MRHRLLLVVVLCLPGGIAAADPMPYLPVDKVVEAEVLDVDAPPEYAGIRARLKRAVMADPDWFYRHIGEAGSLAAAGYDPKLGISEEELERYLNIVEFELDVRSAGYLDITAHSDMTGMQLTFDIVPDEHPLQGVRYNGEEDYFVTKFGRLTLRQRYVSAVLEPEIGRWDGVEYALFESTRDDWRFVSFAVGRREKDGRCALVYSIVQESRAEGLKGWKMMALYDL